MTTISEYYALRPGSYGHIVRLVYSQQQRVNTAENIISHELDLVLSKSHDLTGETLLLHFEGVSKLHFSQPEWSLATFGLIELHEQEPGYFATEEEGLIRFNFQAFEARIVDR